MLFFRRGVGPLPKGFGHYAKHGSSIEFKVSRFYGIELHFLNSITLINLPGFSKLKNRHRFVGARQFDFIKQDQRFAVAFNVIDLSTFKKRINSSVKKHEFLFHFSL